MKRVIFAAVVMGLLTAGLTACDPPIPPDVQAQMAETKHVCIDGNVTVQSPGLMNTVVQNWSDSITGSCAGTTLEQVTVKPEVAIGYSNSSDCAPAVSTPVAVDAGVLVFTVNGVTDLTLSPKSVAGILNGTITDWADPSIAKDNPDSPPSSEPIAVRKITDKDAFASLNEWMTRLGAPLDPAHFTLTSNAAYATPAEGEIAVIANSQAVANSVTPAGIAVTGPDGQPATASPANQAIVEASSQWEGTTKGTELTVTLDPKIKPAKPDGFDLVAPYQAIYPLYVTVCGEASQLKQSVGFYFLRQDSQGALAASNYNPLAETIRVQALSVMGKGLPAGK